MTDLNLARKWRSQTFDTIVGQELCVRMLKNSLYKNSYFPVYLFCGQRGCGKTSTARIFAAAINCAQLPQFQKEPTRYSVPCLSCDSCVALRAGKHPDFIEIDAASHTGVDNVRYIIDAASLLPLMGTKKIYLIDEAHMLSKSAFNAFLKILEEPPASVLFILATTDPEKIIETVRSRCFQLFFRPISASALESHLAHICQQESIAYDQEALQIIVAETEGSARDAINVLEQARFSSKRITKESIQLILGHLDDSYLPVLLAALIQKTPQQLLVVLHELQLNRYNASVVWRKLINCVRAALWLKCDVESPLFTQHHDILKKIVAAISWRQLQMILDTLYQSEQLFAKTIDQHGFFEMILLQISQKIKRDNNSSGGPLTAQVMPLVSDAPLQSDDSEQEEDDDEDADISEDDAQSSWHNFLRHVEQSNDPLAYSIFKQALSTTYDANRFTLTVVFGKQFVFFKDLLEQTKAVWQPLIDKSFAENVIVEPLFNGEQAEVKPSIIKRIEEKPPVVTMPVVPRNQTQTREYKNGKQQRREVIYIGHVPSIKDRVDVSDTQLWPKAQMVLNHFPGTVHEIRAS